MPLDQSEPWDKDRTRYWALRKQQELEELREAMKCVRFRTDIDPKIPGKAPRSCPICGITIDEKRVNAEYCSPNCLNVARYVRAASEGKTVYHAVVRTLDYRHEDPQRDLKP